MIIERFAQQVRAYPDKLAVKTENGSLTYSELDRFANRIANKIGKISRAKGNIGLLMEDGTAMIAAVLGVLKTGNTYVPLVSEFPAKRIQYIINHAGIDIFITDRRHKGLVSEACAARDVSIATIDEIQAEDLDDRLDIEGSLYQDSNAYILYTSGSTGLPKGVLQTQRNILFFIDRYTENLGLTAADRLTLFSSFSHDASVVDIYAALLNGATLFPLDLKREEIFSELPGWLRAEKISVWHSVPTVFRYFISSLKGKPALPDLRYVVLGGETVLKSDIDRFCSLLPQARLYNLYGQTESTYNSGQFFSAGDSSPVTEITLGEVVKGTEIYLLDEDRNELDPLEVGEIVVVGPHVSPGYWQDDRGNEEKFVEYSPQQRLYFTGDLGRRLLDGRIEFLGRKDTQVKLRGYRIELGEIENVMMQYEGVSGAAVTAVESPSRDLQEKYIAAFFTANRNIDLDSLGDFLKERLLDYMIPTYFKQLLKLPLTVSGKLDRRALPIPDLTLTREYVPPGKDLEKKLVDLWAEILRIGKDVIGINSSFFELGGHSLSATLLTSKIHQELRVKVPLVQVYNKPTIKGLAEYIEQAQQSRYLGVQPVERKEYYPLSSDQKRIYFLQLLEVEGTGYNLPYFFVVGKHADKERLAHTFRQLIRRHEILRTSFEMLNQEPVQRVHQAVDFVLDCRQVSRQEEQSMLENFIAPFDLSRAPLVRALLLQVEDQFSLLFDFHHIIADNTSVNFLEEEFFELYDGKQLPALKLHYKDYAQWQNSEQYRATLHKQEEYWLETFSGELPVLELPYDYQRPFMQSFAGSAVVFLLSKQETRSLKELAMAAGVTPYMVLLSAFNVLLSRLCNQEDITVGVPIAVRNRTELQRLIGMVVNTIPLRNWVSGDKPFIDFLKEVKEKAITAYEYREYPLEDLVSKISLYREPGRLPLFDVMFNLLDERNFKGDTSELTEQDLYFYSRGTTRSDLTLTAVDREESILFRCEYSTLLFKAETMARIMEYFKRILSCLIAEPGVRTADIEILSETEKERILEMSTAAREEFALDRTLHRLFEDQAERSPHRSALVGPGTGAPVPGQGPAAVPAKVIHLTYQELNQQSTHLAYRLKETGVQPNTVVGLMVQRSVEMIIGILGILKAGAAYLPLDPDYPHDRIEYMLSDSRAGILLTTGNTDYPGHISVHFGTQPVIPPDQPLLPAADYRKLAAALAYVIYTSGTTGSPKAVPITHANLLPLFHWGLRYLNIGPADRTMQNLAYHFDWSVWEIFITLLAGAALYTVPADVLLNPEPFIDLITENKITLLHITPSQWHYFVNFVQQPLNLRCLFIGAERLNHELVRRSFESIQEGCRLFNMYGPTEAAIISSVLEIDRAALQEYKELSCIPIGKPTANAALLILDKHLQLCPILVKGELYISGYGLARGYLNQPGLTAEKFIPGPMSREPNIPSCQHSISPGVQRNAARIYRTGDLARWLANGQIEFLGRIDHQVKIRGLRIEPGEIESLLLSHEKIMEAVVVARENQQTGDRYLCAYVVTRGGEHGPGGPGGYRAAPNPGPGAAPVQTRGPTMDSPEELREFLSRNLPGYMIPSYVVEMEKIPLTVNGKVDWKALPEPELKPEEYTAPRNEVEQELQEIWAEVLGMARDVIGIDSNFFLLGGHSLKVAILRSKIRKKFAVDFSLAEIFKTPSIRAIASLIRAVHWAGDQQELDTNQEIEELIL